MMWNGRLYSHSSEEDNDKIKGINYDSGDVINVTTNVNELIFIKESNNKQYKMKINLT